MSSVGEGRDRALRVLVVDDEELFRVGLAMILGYAPDIDVVATCDGPDAVTAVTRDRPDVVLLDIQMPGVDGITVLRELRGLPEPPVVAMLTAFGSDDYVRSALQHGAVYYLLKDTAPEQLVREVRALAAGVRSLAPGIMPTVIDGYLASVARPGPGTAAVEALTLASGRH